MTVWWQWDTGFWQWPTVRNDEALAKRQYPNAFLVDHDYRGIELGHLYTTTPTMSNGNDSVEGTTRGDTEVV